MIDVNIRNAGCYLLHLAPHLRCSSLRIEKPAGGDAAGNRHIGDAGLGEQLIAQRHELFPDLAACRKEDNHFFVEAKVLLAQEFKLVIHDSHADDQSDRNGKL